MYTVHKKKRSRTGLPNIVRMCFIYKPLKDTNVPKKAEQIIHQTIVRPILIFGSECWTLRERERERKREGEGEREARTADYNSRHESYQNDTRGHQMGQKEKQIPVQTE